MLIELSAIEINALLPQIAAIYRNGFTLPPYNKPEEEIADFARTLPTQTNREGFRFLGAFAGDPERLAGFCYGYTTRAGKWWYAAVKPALPPELAARWLEDSYEMVELVVDPAYQGQGFGSRLHDGLLKGLPYERAVLSTLQAETVAKRLYRTRGWVTLLEDFYFPGVTRRYQVMGIELK
jgi:hypothetical protein